MHGPSWTNLGYSPPVPWSAASYLVVSRCRSGQLDDRGEKSRGDDEDQGCNGDLDCRGAGRRVRPRRSSTHRCSTERVELPLIAVERRRRPHSRIRRTVDGGAGRPRRHDAPVVAIRGRRQAAAVTDAGDVLRRRFGHRHARHGRRRADDRRRGRRPPAGPSPSPRTTTRTNAEVKFRIGTVEVEFHANLQFGVVSTSVESQDDSRRRATRSTTFGSGAAIGGNDDGERATAATMTEMLGVDRWSALPHFASRPHRRSGRSRHDAAKI